MIADSILTEEQLIQQATEVLISKLGLVEALRFLALKPRERLRFGRAASGLAGDAG